MKNIFLILLFIIVSLFNLNAETNSEMEPSNDKSELLNLLEKAEEFNFSYKQSYLFDLDVIEYFELANIYNTDLKLKVFKKSDEYETKLNDLKKIKKETLNKTFYFNITNKLTKYNLKRQGFYIDLGTNETKAPFSNPLPTIIDEIYFPSLVTEKSNLQYCPKSLICEKIFVPIKENDAINIEGNENVNIYLIFKISGKKNVNYNTYYQGTLYSRTDKFLYADNVNLVIGDKLTNKILYQRTYLNKK